MKKASESHHCGRILEMTPQTSLDTHLSPQWIADKLNSEESVHQFCYLGKEVINQKVTKIIQADGKSNILKRAS